VIKIHRLRPASVIDEVNVVTLTTRPRIAKQRVGSAGSAQTVVVGTGLLARPAGCRLVRVGLIRGDR
jgi:hypothetical protein